MNQDKRIQLRVSELELSDWKDRAKESGKTLTAWIRYRCNGAPYDQTLRCGKAVDVVTGEMLTKVERAIKKGPTCEHGVHKGYHCWQCKGMAVIK